ncbi:hypothetical protein [Reinekea sp. G2M2-21]|uniref:hypothetical protein n=1 Tax=Reinekea sp. G2M2-21 TaxID=2788942 RepID=UPI0018AAE98E|nr:hypothetical protein [Reinekea sp. G2M2-21]
MYRVLVHLNVIDFNRLAEFEDQAADIMADYGGQIRDAYEVTRQGIGPGTEIHLVEFPNEDAFQQYRCDNRLLALASLRDSAIVGMSVQRLGAQKQYGTSQH